MLEYLVLLVNVLQLLFLMGSGRQAAIELARALAIEPIESRDVKTAALAQVWWATLIGRGAARCPRLRSATATAPSFHISGRALARERVGDTIVYFLGA